MEKFRNLNINSILNYINGYTSIKDGDSLKTFTEYEIGDLKLKNRIVMPPMCMYEADRDGMAKEFHRTHYASRAIGGVGLIIVEATGVVPNGRISNHDLGIWSDEHIAGLKSIVDGVHSHGAKIAIQLAHAGRKCETDDDYIVAPSPIRHSNDYRDPKELSKEDIKNLSLSFQDASRRANEAGFDAIEIHAAHGYLIHEFLSPISNKREDEYGGSLENRVRFLQEIIDSVKQEWPREKPIIVRVSADDYVDGGIDKEEMASIINQVKDSIDMVHVSTGALVDRKIDIYPGYQIPHAELIKKKCNIPTITVGIITSYNQSEEILHNGRADLVAFGRALLRDPYLALNMAYENDIDIGYPKPYLRGFDMPKAFV